LHEANAIIRRRHTVTIYVNTFFEKRLERLLDMAGRVEAAFAAAGLEYRVVGGLAVYLYVEEVEPDAGRLTRDIDIAVRREDLGRIAQAVESFGLTYCQVRGNDMLVQSGAASARRAVHLIFTGERVKPDYPEAAPAIGACRKLQGVRLIPLADLVHMKLTSFRLKDQAHLKDLDEARLISPEIENGLSEILLARLAHVRASE
jgi:hypothetical protein